MCGVRDVRVLRVLWGGAGVLAVRGLRRCCGLRRAVGGTVPAALRRRPDGRMEGSRMCVVAAKIIIFDVIFIFHVIFFIIFFFHCVIFFSHSFFFPRCCCCCCTL